jgi:alkylation response protein AidB-like acyl-CoA dehydrogenase
MSAEKQRNVSEAEARQVAEDSRQKEWRKPSFMKELFLGNFRFDWISPFPNYGRPERTEYLEFVARLKQYFLEEIDPIAIDENGEFPPDAIDRLAEIGALSMNMPKEYGGMGFSKSEYCRTMELSASYEGSLMGFLSPHQSVGVPECVKLFGTEEQKQEYLPRCARGEVSAFALTESGAGSDPARLETTLAEDPDDPAFWLLNGEKVWCTNGLVAKLLIVMARHKETGQISAVIVETEWPGVEIAHRCRFMGLSALQNGVLTFNNVRVPKANVLGAPGKGLRIALTALNTGRLSIPYGALSCAKKALEMSRVWAAERQQWGKPLVEHEAIALKLARMAATTFAMEAVIDLACQLTDNARHDTRLESAASKEFNTSRAWNLIDDAMQIRGGRGYEKESSLIARGERAMPVERLMRDMRVQRIFEGASEIMHLLMAREAVDKHLEVAGAFVDPKASLATKLAALPRVAAFYAAWYPRTLFGIKGWTGYGEYGPLAPHLRYIHRASKRLARQAFHGMLCYQAGLEKRQGFLFRWVDIAMELYAMAALCSRVHAMREAKQPEAEGATELCDVFCRMAAANCDRLFHELWHNDDPAQAALAKAVAAGKYTWTERGIVSLEEAEQAHAERQRRAQGWDSIEKAIS